MKRLLALVCLLTACAAGPQGAPGQSIIGPPGGRGSDSIPVVPVKLCPGDTHYPDVFVEIALCIDNTLWGVYSANDGFLVELVPGYYKSNAIGSACNLTIKENCEVVW